MPDIPPVYFADADGVEWRVHDCAFGPPLARPHHRRAVPIGDARANSRYFVSIDGVVRCMPLKPKESRATDDETLVRQFAASGFVAQSPSASPPSDRDDRQTCWVMAGAAVH